MSFQLRLPLEEKRVIRVRSQKKKLLRPRGEKQESAVSVLVRGRRKGREGKKNRQSFPSYCYTPKGWRGAFFLSKGKKIKRGRDTSENIFLFSPEEGKEKGSVDQFIPLSYRSKEAEKRRKKRLFSAPGES